MICPHCILEGMIVLCAAIPFLGHATRWLKAKKQEKKQDHCHCGCDSCDQK